MSNPVEAMFESVPSSCPSSLVLDRWHLGELAAARAADVEAHFADCAACRARGDERVAGFDALPVDGDRLFQRIQAAGPRSPVRDFFDRFLPARSFEDRRPVRDFIGELLGGSRRPVGGVDVRWGAVVAAAVAALVVVAPHADEPTIRAKGGDVTFRVFRERGGTVEEQVSGAAFAARDRLRFDVKAADASQIMIVGVEESGAVFTYYPEGGEKSDRVRRTDDGALVGAIELDDYDGREWLHLVRCDRAFARAELVAAPGRIDAPDGCDLRVFEIARRE